MNVTAQNVGYIVTRQNLETKEVDFLQSFASYGRDDEDTLRLRRPSWSNTFSSSHMLSYNSHAAKILKAVKKYCSEEGYSYGIAEARQTWELLPIPENTLETSC